MQYLSFILFHFSGCFAAGVYIGLHFTILSIAASEDDTESSEDGEDSSSSAHPAYAVLCLFPIVAGIFLIFIW